MHCLTATTEQQRTDDNFQHLSSDYHIFKIGKSVTLSVTLTLQSQQASRHHTCDGYWAMGSHYMWGRLTSGMSEKPACKEGQGLQSRACCTCNAKLKVGTDDCCLFH